MNQENQVSSCCGDKVIWDVVAGATTPSPFCSKCRKPCDLKVDILNQEKTTQKWREEFDEVFGGPIYTYYNEYGTKKLGNVDRSLHIKYFISQLLEEARKEGYDEGLKKGEKYDAEAQEIIVQNEREEARLTILEEVETIGKKIDGTFPVGFWEEVRELK